MFGRGKNTQQFDITEHPAVLAALDAMWQQAYDTGRRDALAIARDFRDEERAQVRSDAPDPNVGHYLTGIDAVIELLEVAE